MNLGSNAQDMSYGFTLMYFVYILVCLDTGRSYVGHTDDLLRRFRSHVSGSTRTTREKLIHPVMAHWETYPTRSEAMHRERYYKAGSGHRVKAEIVIGSLRQFADDLTHL
jgi:predicted GIY-YIG superfamily endonuclease